MTDVNPFTKLFDDKLKFIPTVLVYEIFEYWCAVCVDCDIRIIKSYICKCDRTRCAYHQTLNVSEYGCMICHNDVYDIKYRSVNNLCHTTGCEYRASYGNIGTINACGYHKQQGMVYYGLCRVVKCWFRSAYKSKYANDVICTLHMKSDNVYEYNYANE